MAEEKKKTIVKLDDQKKEAPKKKETKIEQPAPKKVTLKEKIDRTVDDWKDNPEALKKQLFGLFQRVLYPDQFCPECDNRLFFNGQAYSCPNCGYSRAFNTPAPVANSTPTVAPTGEVRPSATGNVPKEVEDMISKANQDMKAAPRRGGPTKLGAKIQKLVNERDSSGPQQITSQDEAAVKRDPNASSQINWV
jgi:hypothetical protein